jgi:hypothetical protein
MRLIPLAAAAAVVCATPALAQDTQQHLLSVGVMGGGTLPAGQLSRGAVDPGYQVGALAQIRTPLRWLALRVDGTYGRMGGGTEDVVDETGARIGHIGFGMSVASASANVVARVPGLHSAVQPYALAGMATYRLQSYITEFEAPIDIPIGSFKPGHVHGAQLGLGLDAPVGRARAFAEVRYERVGPYLRIMPVGVGVRIR